MLAPNLWAITSYFNPRHFRRRLSNFRVFRSRLRVPLLAVELAFDADFELGAGDADLLIQRRGHDVMWQKERLLNMALASLPASCGKVVAIDCDTIFGAEDWAEQTCRALDDFPLVQPFNRVYHLERDALANNSCDPARVHFEQASIPVAVAAGRPPRECLLGILGQLKGSHVMGMAWAMRRAALERLGFYDACIVGGGSRAFSAAAYGCFDETVRLNQMNNRQRDHYLAWARPFFQEIQGNVSAVEAPLFHLWHGDISNRQYHVRFGGLTPFAFDPYLDLALDANGAWRWNSDKPLMHQYVREYFAARKEDG